MRRRVGAALGLAALLPAAAGAAFFDGNRADVLSAAAAGRGGVAAPAGAALDALAGNPAGLPEQGEWHAGLLGALGRGDRGRWGAGLAALAAPGLRWGLLYTSAWDRRLAAVDEDGLSGVLSLSQAGGQSLGLRLNGHWLRGASQGQALSGASLDLGWLLQRVHLPGLAGRWSFGLAADNVAAAWSDEAWAQSVPSAARGGLAWRPVESLWLGGEAQWISDPLRPAGVRQEWRGGLQWSPWRPGWVLRGGWRGDGGHGGDEASLGLGAPLGLGARLDYAAQLGLGGGLPVAHRVALSWSYQRPEDEWLRARPEMVLTDPDSGAVERASFRIEVDGRLGAEQWWLELRDADGRLRRTLGPWGGTEAVADWDGRDDAGRVVEEGRRVYYALVARTPQGTVRRGYSLALDQALKAGVGGAAGDLPPPRLKPVFAPGGDALEQVVMELPDLDAESWRLELKDSQDHTLRRFAGLGHLPATLHWDGRDQDGRPVQDPLGVRVDFQLRESGGRLRRTAMPLFSQQAFEIAQRGTQGRPQMSLAAMGLPLVEGRPAVGLSEGFLAGLLARAEAANGGLAQALRDKALNELRARYVRRETGGTVQVDAFRPGSAELDEGRLALLDDLPPAADGSLLVLRGLPDEDTPAGRDLARRRTLAVARRLSNEVLQGRALTLGLAPPGAGAGIEGRSRPLGQAAGVGTRGLAAAPPEAVSARYAVADELRDRPGDRPDRPLDAARAADLLRRWGLQPRATAGLLTQWCPATGKVALAGDGWVWITDAQGETLRSLWYEPDLNAAGRLRFSEDGTRLWMRADGWRRWISLKLSVEEDSNRAEK